MTVLLDPDAVLFVPALPDIPGLRELTKGAEGGGGSTFAARAAVARTLLTVADLHE